MPKSPAYCKRGPLLGQESPLADAAVTLCTPAAETATSCG